MTTLTDKDLIAKAAVSAQLLRLSSASDEVVATSLLQITEHVAQQIGKTVDETLTQIEHVTFLLHTSGIYETSEFEALHELCKTTSDILTIDAAQNEFIKFVKEEVCRRSIEYRNKQNTTKQD